MRTVIHRHNGTKQKERIYLGGCEIYCEYNGSGVVPQLERETLHIMDDKQRIALVETKTKDASVPASTLPETLIRYQFGNHLGSAVLELDREAKVISYEEYHPYGTSSYQAVRNQAETPKRYRYTGKERDEETGLYYHGARYYAAWIGRWTAPDPTPNSPSGSVYSYCANSPICLADLTGKAEAIPNAQLSYTFDHWIAQVLGGVKNSARNIFLLTASDNSSKQDAPMALRVSNAPLSLASAFNEGPPSFLKAAQKMFQVSFAEVEELNDLWKRASNNEKNSYPTSRTNMFKLLRTDQSLAAQMVRKAFDLANVEFDPETGHPKIKISSLGISPETIKKMAAERADPTQRMVGQFVAKALAAKSQTISVVTSTTAALTQGFKSMIPGSEFYDYAKYTVGGGSLATGLQASAVGAKMAVQALATPAEAGIVGTGAVIGAAVVAGVGSTVLAGATVRAAARGEDTPMDVVDKFYGTQFSDVYAWQKRSTAARVGLSVVSLGLSESWYSLNKLAQSF